MTIPDNRRIRRFRKRLQQWGKFHRKDYPWRRMKDPYAILVAEFMLHRTQVRQVENVYLEFMAKYPNLKTLSEAPDEEVLGVLAPLGLHWRNRGMLKALRNIWEQHRMIPLEAKELLSLPGIGPYIAGATLCFATDQAFPLVDSNTVRVIGRVFGLDLHREARRRADVKNMITASCDPEHPRDFYFALIDLAHSLCRPQDPRCRDCPLLTLPCDYGKSS